MPNSTREIPRCENGSSYIKGCRCDFCRHQIAIAQSVYRLRKLNRERGQVDGLMPVDPTEARDLVRQAHKRGISDEEIARMTGLTRLPISKIRRDQVKWIRYDTAKRIHRALADEENRSLAPGSRVSSKWAAQMVRGLCAQGWSKEHQREIIQKNLGRSAGFIQHIVHPNNKGEMTAQSLADMKWLVRAIGNKTGPSKRSMTLSRKLGYFPIKHYNLKGDLIKSSLTKEQRAKYEGV